MSIGYYIYSRHLLCNVWLDITV